MRNFLYAFASLCAIFAFILLLAPAVSGIAGGRSLLTGFLGISLSGGVAPFTTALAVIPLCIAFAYDRLTS
jgi:hypothetical protein